MKRLKNTKISSNHSERVRLLSTNPQAYREKYPRPEFGFAFGEKQRPSDQEKR